MKRAREASSHNRRFNMKSYSKFYRACAGQDDKEFKNSILDTVVLSAFVLGMWTAIIIKFVEAI